jgi:arylsulfatase/arylsulfatase A
VYEGGIRSPFFAHWPGTLAAGPASQEFGAHLDLAPTILEICRVNKPAEVKFDGRSLWPLLTRSGGPWPERTLFIQSHRGDEPVLYHNFAARGRQWKLVSATGFGQESLPASGPKFELFDLESDPYEQTDVAGRHPDVVAKLKSQYEAWFKDVGSTRTDNYLPPRMVVGTPQEPKTVLTRQDWRGAGWGPGDEGHWLVTMAGRQPLEVKVIVTPGDSERTLQLRIGTLERSVKLAANATEHSFGRLDVPAGDQKVEAWLESGGRREGVRFVELQRGSSASTPAR